MFLPLKYEQHISQFLRLIKNMQSLYLSSSNSLIVNEILQDNANQDWFGFLLLLLLLLLLQMQQTGETEFFSVFWIEAPLQNVENC